MIGTSSDAQKGPFPLSREGDRVILVGLSLYLLAKAVFFVVMGFNSQYLMDEFDTISHHRFLDGAYVDNLPTRTLLYVFFYAPAFSIANTSVEVMRIARAETIGLSFLAMLLLYKVATAIGRSRLEALFVVGMTLAFSTHMERAFLVRPETLILVFGLCALLCSLRSRLTRRWIFLAGVFAGLAFVSAQKAAYFDFALGLALVGTALLERSLWRACEWGALLVLGWAAVLGVYVGGFSLTGAEPSEILQNIFFGASAENLATGHLVYEAEGKVWPFKWQTATRNIFPYLLCLFGWGVALTSLRHDERRRCIAFIFSTVMVVLIYGFHPAPWPYNFILAIPFLALWAPDLVRYLMDRRPTKTSIIVVISATVLFSSLTRNVHHLGHTNGQQEAVMAEVEALLNPNEHYIDGMLMVPKRSNLGPWMGAGLVQQIRAGAKHGKATVLESVFAKEPKVIILNYRLLGLGEALRPYIEGRYRALTPNILLRKNFLQEGQGQELSFPLKTEMIFAWAHTY